MPSCYLQVYEKLTSSSKDYKYWKEYTSFYESYWGGPTSPYGIWFGNEYETFENALIDHMKIQKKELKQCLFIKENDFYYICPSDPNRDNQNYSFLVNNIVPLHWFLLFDHSQKKVCKTYCGFGAIHYTNTVSKSLNKMKEFINLKKQLNKTDIEFRNNYLKLIDDFFETCSWLETFDSEGILILNYGDLLANFPQNSLDKEDSVKIMDDIKEMIGKELFKDASDILNFLIERWTKIEFANQKNESNLSN